MTGRILIVDPVATNRIVLRVKLASAFYDVSQAASTDEALRQIRTVRPDLVIASDGAGDQSGTELCRRIRAAAGRHGLPVVLLQCQPTAAQRLAGLMAGADDILTRPLDDLVLLARLRSLLRARNAEAELRLRDDTQRALGLAEEAPGFARPARVALVPAGPGHDMPGTLAKLRHALPDQFTIATPDAVLRDRADPAEVFVIAEAAGRGGKGLAFLSDLRARAETRHAAILYVAGAHQRQSAAAALDLGADDLMIGTLDAQELALRLQKQIARKRTAEKLRANMRDGVQAALIDPLTGLFNRRYALPHLGRLIDTATALGKPLAVMIADLDHFKRVNDRHGHAAGDAVLTEVATRLSSGLRAADLLARHGGEEFLIAMPDTTREQAMTSASRLCRDIAAQPFALPGGQLRIPLTISIGVAIGGAPGALQAQAELLEAADRALYAAKADGRNQALIDTPSAA
ncbi:diguanylate cyclase [Thalassococcus sp. BH17M4-6]|uniref:diguanylate cyclase n=1 Tax=Thalassococcus sp. BH17M4-6 TaxID=3413148 RepID=UPI003BE534ED